MLEVIFGTISGIVSGMGMGGGTILIMLLTCFQNIDQKVAQATNLLFFIPTSIIATIINIKNNKINFKTAIPIATLGVIGAIAGAIIATKIDVTILRKMFSIFLFLIAVYEIYDWHKKYIKKKETN